MLRLRNPVMDGIRRFGLHPPLEETLQDEQGVVDMTSLRDTLIALPGNPTFDAQGHGDEITGNVPGYVDDNVSILSGSLSPDLWDLWRYGCPRSPDWDSDGDADIDEGAE